MSLDWIQFVGSAIDQAPDDPFVQLLRGRLSAGCQVVRVCFQRACFKYHVTLMCRQVISDVRIPHAAPFTHWSFEAGRRMHTTENEAERFEVLLGEKLRPVEDEVGRTYLQAIVVEIVRQLQPPATTALLADRYLYRVAATSSRSRAILAVEGALKALGANLVRELAYTREQATTILDQALARWAARYFHVRARVDQDAT